MSTKPKYCIRCLASIKSYLKINKFSKPIVPALEACVNCHRCATCRCNCITCTSCRARVPMLPTRYCNRCKMCKRCDRCRKMPHYLPSTRWVGCLGPTRINTLDRTLGIELEIADWGSLENYLMHYVNYERAHDWSVKPSELEMVIQPSRGDYFLKSMMELAVTLAKSKASVNETCALHVHVGGTELSYWELRRLLRVYAKIEQEIYDYLILPHRRDTPTVVHYCQMMTRPHIHCERCDRYDQQYPRTRRVLEDLHTTVARMDRARNTSELKECFLKMLYNIPRPSEKYSKDRIPERVQTLNTHKGGRYEWCRYVGLNLHAWQYRGTIEWRMKEATTQLDELICWPLWCGWFVETITKMSEKDSTRWWTLVDFTERYMPKYLTAWVSNKVSQRKDRMVMS